MLVWLLGTKPECEQQAGAKPGLPTWLLGTRVQKLQVLFQPLRRGPVWGRLWMQAPARGVGGGPRSLLGLRGFLGLGAASPTPKDQEFRGVVSQVLVLDSLPRPGLLAAAEGFFFLQAQPRLPDIADLQSCEQVTGCGGQKRPTH